jgi:hypothetical protein
MSTEGPPATAENPRPPRWWVPLACLAFAFLVYWPTLTLPWSFYDDVPYFLVGAEETRQQVAAGQYADAFDNLMRWDENNVGPTLRLYVLVQWLAFGTWSAPWHFVKILTFFLVIWGLAEIVALCRGRAPAQAVTILAFTLFNAPSIHPDYQTHFISFARLLTTDSIMTPFAVWAVVFAWHAVYTHRGAPLLMLAVTLFFSTLTKATGIHHVASILLWLAFVAIREFGSRGPWDGNRRVCPRQFVGVVGVVVLASLPGLLFFRVWQSRPVFGYVDLPLPSTVGEIADIARQYAAICSEALGFLWLLAIAHAIRMIPRGREGGSHLLLLLLFASAFAVQCRWPIVYTRYAIIFTPWLCPLVGLMVESAVERCAASTGRRRHWLGAVSVGLAGAVVVFWPLYFQVLPRGLTLAYVLIPGVVAFGVAAWAVIVHGADGRNPARRVAGFVVAGVTAFQLLLLVPHARENARCYADFEKTLYGIIDDTSYFAKSLPPDEKGIVYTDFVTAHFNRLVTLLGIAPKVTLRDYPPAPLPGLAKNERLLIWHDRNAYPWYGMRRTSLGLWTDVLAEGRGGEPLQPLGEGDEVSIPVPLSRGATVTAISVNADPSTWNRKLDLDLVAVGRDGETALVGTLQGRHLTRPLMGPQVLSLERPFVVPFDSDALVLRPRAKVAGATLLLNSPVAVPGAPAPWTIRVWGARPGAEPLPLLARHDRRFHTFVLLPPSYIVGTGLGDDRVPPDRLIPGIIGNIRYRHSLEMYGPAE